MKRTIRSMLSPGLLLGIVAVVIASAGSATAASMITGAKIRNGTVTGKDIRNGTIAPKDLRRGAVGTRQLNTATVSQLQATPVTRVVTTQALADFPSAATLEARCPEGQVATGGGGALASNPDLGDLRWSRPILDATGTPVGWQGRIVNAQSRNGGPETVETAELYVICTPAA